MRISKQVVPLKKRFRKDKLNKLKRRLRRKYPRRVTFGEGIINSAIDKLPVELHVPGYQFCGPGTNLQKRLARGDSGINGLDRACKEHDIVYSKYSDTQNRYEADKKLASEAWKRVTSKDASLKERGVALSVAAAMKAKMGLTKRGKGVKLPRRKKCKKTKRKSKNKKGKGLTTLSRRRRKCKKKNKKTKKRLTFNGLMRNLRTAVKAEKPSTVNDAVDLTFKMAKRAVKSGKKFNKIVVPRIIPIPKTGGVLPLVPIFAGLSALGSLIGGTTAIVKTIGEANRAKDQMKESERHNRMMEAIAVGGNAKKGEGIYLQPYKKGYGLYLAPYDGKIQNDSKNS